MWQQQDWVFLLKPLADAGHLDAVRLLHILGAVGRPTSAGDVGLLKQLGDCFLQAQQWTQALDAYKAALALLPEEQQQQEQAQEQSQPNNQQEQQEEAQQQQEQEQSQQQQQERRQRQEAQQQQEQEQSQQQQQEQRQRQEAQQQQAQDQQPQQPLNNVSLQACCAAAMYPQGGPHAEAALHLLHAVLADPHGRNLPAALRLCAQAAADQQRWPAAVAAAVRLLAQLPTDKEGARVLAQAAQDPRGMQALQAAVLQRDAGSAAGKAGLAAPAEAAVAAPRAPAALCFLAHTLLTQGVVQPSVQLYRQAVQLNPECSRCALGLAQALEVQCDYAGVLQVVLGFCSSNAKQRLGPLRLQTLTEVPALQQLSQQPCRLGSLQWYQQQQQQQQQQQHSEPSSMQCSEQGAQTRRHTDQPQQPTHQQEARCSQQKEGQPEPDHNQLCCNSFQALHITPSQVQQDATKQGAVSPVATGQLASTPAAVAAVAAGEAAYSRSFRDGPQQAGDLPALALALTAAKVLFCGGALWTARQLLQLLLPAEQAAATAVQPLQHSSIRNEAAYAALLHKLLAGDPAAALWSRQGFGVKPEVVYVCGDSHVLPIAWRKVTLEGSDHLLVPLLITGCKVWHLRTGSTHPCARQLEAALAAVPRGSKVLMVLGEIDCREGLLTVVAKRKYGCLEGAVAATVCVYVNALLQLSQAHALQRLWVHCVPPVLPETRHVVQLFNTTLKQQLALQARHMHPAQAQGRSSNAQQQQQQPLYVWQTRQTGHVRFLDLESQLLSDGQWLHFDGTHLHPGYVQELLQPAMACNSQ